MKICELPLCARQRFSLMGESPEHAVVAEMYS